MEMFSFLAIVVGVVVVVVVVVVVGLVIVNGCFRKPKKDLTLMSFRKFGS